ncbi:hypothetical protein [Senegalia massiliensis]|uniref:Uncharacterized protein n=1 Tax=Senegalia massiliensis TaxID=1720316 RepID=A0A845QVE1_9CLOT|nr:hypothetical protein [Senegalia massiliensis]NBI05759.1 hypothetical protein [Senegalia massiliensis]
MKKLTIFYNKRTGSIKELCSGEQSMDWFGEEKRDYEEIFDFIIVDYDEYIVQNLHQFEIKDSKVVLKNKSSLNKYL